MLTSEVDQSSVLRIRNVGRRLGDKVVWIDCLDIPRGQIVAVIGASGSGKSTLLHMLGGLAQADYHESRRADGSRLLSPMLVASFISGGSAAQYDLCKGSSRQFCQRVGFVFQSAYLLQSATASANIALGALAARANIDRQALERLCDGLAIHRSFLEMRSSSRSGGERQRIALGRAFARSPNLILADEPTANLDPKLAEETISFLRDWTLAANDRTTIWVTHDVSLAARFADIIVVLDNGRLAQWTTWPQPNPGDPSVLRKWIDGEPSTIELGSSAAVPISKRKDFVAPTAASLSQRIAFWISIGIADEFNEPGADGVYILRRWTSMVPPANQPTQGPRRNFVGLLKSFSSKATVFRLCSLVAAMIVLWMQVEWLQHSIRDLLRAPTLNPVVISSRALIDDRAINDTRLLLARDRTSAQILPDAFGRYEFDHRRITVTREKSTHEAPKRCEAERLEQNQEIIAHVTAINPAEPMLRRLKMEKNSAIHDVIADRTDGLWSAWASRAVLSRLASVIGATADLKFLCLQVAGFWLTAEIKGVMIDPPRGRFGPYDIIISGTQWRDFGPARDRDYYQSSAVYFEIDPEASRGLVEKVREKAAEIYEPPNTRLVQSLANEAAFERISAALDRSMFSVIIIGFLGATSVAILLLVVFGFVSENFQNNLKSICVVIAMGARSYDILIVQMTRVVLVLMSTGAIVGTGALALAGLQLIREGSLSLQTVEHLLERFGIAFLVFSTGTLVMTAIANWWCCLQINRRSLTDQLKELE